MAKHNDIYNHSIDYDPDTATDDVTSVADNTDKPRKKVNPKAERTKRITMKKAHASGLLSFAFLWINEHTPCLE